jgi:2-polyprenyl-3-methyl-5-hydroxy-6-metoxy-1,4-benzoquinol methylase
VSDGGMQKVVSARAIVSTVATVDEVRTYWERHIHDLEITTHPVGSRGFFDDLDQYHFEKLHHLLRLVNFDGYRGKAVLEVGCGAAVDLARFAKGGAVCTGVDLAESAIALATWSTHTASCSTRPIRNGWSTRCAGC